MANSVNPLPKNPELAGKILEAAHATRLAEMGKIGVWFGSRQNAVVYIAAAIIVISVAAATILAATDSGATPSPLRADMAKAFAALALSALGYMFGSSGSDASHRD